MKLEQTERAVESLEALVKGWPESPLMDRALFTLGWALVTNGRNDAAKTVFERIVDKFPNSTYARQARTFLTRLEAAPNPEANVF